MIKLNLIFQLTVFYLILKKDKKFIPKTFKKKEIQILKNKYKDIFVKILIILSKAL